MNRRLVTVLLALLPLWWGALHAQTGGQDYMSRGRELSKAGKHDQALPYFLLSLELAEARFGLNDPALIPIIDDLAGTQAASGNYRDAEPLYERALRIQEREASRHQTGIVRTLNKLGRIYEATDRDPEALALYRRVIATWAPILGGDHPDVRIAGGRLAKLALRVPSTLVAQKPLAAQPQPRAPPPAAPAQAAKKTTKPETKAAQAPPKPVPKPPAAAPAATEAEKAATSLPRERAGFSVHLTSIRDPRDAGGEWERLRRIHGGLLADLELRVAKADLGAKGGIYYRIKGGILTREDARARCAAIAARGVWCDVKGPEDAGARPMLASGGKTALAARGKTASVKPAPPAGTGATPPAGTGATPPAKAGPAPAPGYRIHLTSIRDPGDAEDEWRRLRRLYGKLLGGLTLTVARADLGPGKGIYYRVQGGTLSRQGARALCARFAARKIWCRVVRPGGEAAEGSLRLALQRGRRLPPSRHRGTRRRLVFRRHDRGCRRSPFT